VGGPTYARGIFDQWAALKTTVENAIDELITPLVFEALWRNEPRVKVTVVEVEVLDELLELSFTANGDGKITATATLPTTRVWIKGETHAGPFKVATTKLTLFVGPTKVAVDYDVFTGLVENVNVIDVPVDHSIKVRTSFEARLVAFVVVRILGDFLGDLLNSIFPGLGEAWKQFVKELPKAVRLVGNAAGLYGAVQSVVGEKTLLDYLIEWTLLGGVGDQIDGFKQAYLQMVTGISEPSGYGLDSPLSQIAALNLTYQGTNVAQLIRDAINLNLRGHLLTIEIGKENGVALGLPWGIQYANGASTLSVTVAGGYGLRAVYSPHVSEPCAGYGYPNDCYAHLYFLYEQYQRQQQGWEQALPALYQCATGQLSATQCSQVYAYFFPSGLEQVLQLCSGGQLPADLCSRMQAAYPTATTTTTSPPTTTTTTPPTTTTTLPPSSEQQLRANAAAHAQQLLQAAQGLEAEATYLQQQLQQLYELYQANPHLGPSIAAAAYPLQQRLDQIQVELGQLWQAYALAQQCATGTLTPQCWQLYG
jgi:hypothetical protein